MYQDCLDNFDLGLLALDTGLTSNATNMQDVAGGMEGHIDYHRRQTLAERMQGDKQDMLSSLMMNNKFEDMGWLEANSDLHEMMELGEVEEVKTEVVEVEDPDDHQALIDEVDKFLTQHEKAFPQATDALPQEPIFGECPMTSSIIDDGEIAKAEKIIDQLFCDTINLDFDFGMEDIPVDDVISDTKLEELEAVIEETEEPDESGYESQFNMSEMYLEDGTKVFIVISPDSPSCSEDSSHIGVPSVKSDLSSVMSPGSDDQNETEPEEIWSPISVSECSKSNRKNRDKKGMRGTKNPIIDKKERKKVQNVEAARRYRDKKKNEQQLLDEEMEELEKKNKILKGKVQEKESELKTLKKLMAELGLIKIAQRKK